MSDLAQHYFVKAGITAFRRCSLLPTHPHSSCHILLSLRRSTCNSLLITVFLFRVLSPAKACVRVPSTAAIFAVLESPPSPSSSIFLTHIAHRMIPLLIQHDTSFLYLHRLRKMDQNRIARATGAVVVTRTDEIQVRASQHSPLTSHCTAIPST